MSNSEFNCWNPRVICSFGGEFLFGDVPAPAESENELLPEVHRPQSCPSWQTKVTDARQLIAQVTCWELWIDYDELSPRVNTFL